MAGFDGCGFDSAFQFFISRPIGKMLINTD